MNLAHLSRRTKVAVLVGVALLCVLGVPMLATADGGVGATLSGGQTNTGQSHGQGSGQGSGQSGGKVAGSQPGAVPGAVDASADEQRAPLRLFCKTETGWHGPVGDAATCAPGTLITCKWDPDEGAWLCYDAQRRQVAIPPGTCALDPAATGCTAAPAAASASPAASAAPPPVVASAAPSAATVVPAAQSPAAGTPTPASTAAEQAAPSTEPGAAPGATPNPSTSPTMSPSASPSASPSVSAAPAAAPMVVTAIGAARSAGMRVWLESNLADDYKAGKQAYQTALNHLIAAARQPGVTGVQFASALGFRHLTSPSEVRAFVKTTSTALRRAVPGVRLGVEVTVPELGCGLPQAITDRLITAASTPCRTALRAKYPAISAANVTSYLRDAQLDRITVASGLYSGEYARYTTTSGGKKSVLTAELAARLQWAGVQALRWSGIAQITAREYGLANDGSITYTKASAKHLIDERLRTPLQQRHVALVTLWGHLAVDGERTYQGLDQGVLWQELKASSLRGQLAAVLNPARVSLSLADDVHALAAAVSEVSIVC